MPNVSYKSKQMIVMRRDLKMRKGKIAAQAGHACVEATLMALAREGRLDQIRATQDWVYVDHAGVKPVGEGGAVLLGVVNVDPVLGCANLVEPSLAGKGHEGGLDAGMAEFHGEATFTCLAFEPLPAEKIDPLTGDLPLY